MDTAKQSRAQRFEVLLRPELLRYFPTTRAAWYETPEEVAAGLEWGREKARLLAWVRRQMTRRLTVRERRCVELYFFQGLTYREVAGLTNRNVSSVHRAVVRALRKLRAARCQTGPKPAQLE